MAAPKLPSQAILTPVGMAQFAHVNEPNTMFNKDGDYQVLLHLSDAEAAPVIAAALAVRDKTKAIQEALKSDPNREIKLAADMPWKQARDRNKALIPGMTAFNFKCKALIRTKETGPDGQPKMTPVRPQLFDAQNKPLDHKTVIVMGGSKVRVAATAAGYYTDKLGVGVSLRLQAVQVIELSKGRDAASFGFAAEAAPAGDAGGFEDLPLMSPEQEAGNVPF